MPPHILAVIVLYRARIESCVSYRDLLRAAKALQKDAGRLSILLYDNSPTAQSCDLPTGTAYHHAARNDGVAGAYNYAIQAAAAKDRDWLLTLDQDTSLPEDFLTKMFDTADKLAADTTIAAIVPQVFNSDRMISPHWYAFGAWPRYLPAGFVGTHAATLFAINSASLLRVSALQRIGGYDPGFWLDASDLVLFARLAQGGGRVFVQGGVRVAQVLSQLDRATPLAPARLRNILDAESAFWDGERSAWAGVMHAVVMVRHLLGMVRRREDPALRRLVTASILDRIAHTRRFRLERWRCATAHRIERADSQNGRDSRWT